MKSLIRLTLSILLFVCVISISYTNHNEHVHAAGVPCKYCGSTNTNYEYSNIPLTCTDPGADYYSCYDCHQQFHIDIPPKGHNFGGDDNITVITPATCTTSGSGTKTCINSVTCGKNISVTIPALGHDYTTTVISAADCTHAGTSEKVCSRCADKQTVTVAALGHNYKVKETKKATCTEDGYTTKVCTRCNDSVTEKLKMTGHNVEYSEKDPTCEEDGYKKGICKNCKEEVIDTIPALGHDFVYSVVKEATCKDEGLEKGICSRCDKEDDKIIAKLEHEYSEDWTVEKEATYTEEGLKYKTCNKCGERIEESIPKKNVVPVALGGGASVAAVSAGVYFALGKSGLLRKTATRKLVKKAAEKLKPSIESKTVFLFDVDDKVKDLLKKQRYLSVSGYNYTELTEAIKEDNNLLIIGVPNESRLDEVLALKEDALNESNVALIIDNELLSAKKDELDKLVNDKKLINYLAITDSPYQVLSKFVLPIAKPELTSDESLENVGLVADAIGIPFVSTIINAYTSGRSIKETIEEGKEEGLSFSDKTSIMASIASILGYDQLESVLNIVENADDIKAAFDKETGLNEKADGVSAAKDIVETISDIIDK